MKKILLGLIGLLFAVPAVAATLPAGYTELEYIESDGTQYIDTGIIALETDEITVIGTATTTGSQFFFSQGASSDNQAFQLANTTATNGIVFDLQNYDPYRIITGVYAYNNVVTVRIANKEIFVNGTSYGTSAGTLTNPTDTMRLFISSAGAMYNIQMQRFTITGKIDLVPAKNASGVVGMYDLVSGQFFTNAGSGTFTGGNELDPCRNLFDGGIYARGQWNNNGEWLTTYGAARIVGSLVPITPNTTYTMKINNTSDDVVFWNYAYFDANKNWLGNRTTNNETTFSGTTEKTFNITDANARYFAPIVAVNDGNTNISDTMFANAHLQLELGSTATAYVPFCANAIKIATTVYNSARFSPVVTELNDTIATIRSVVTNTINQTKAIADLQATKQTRPDENCPAGKKCLLVEDDAGQPHWYEIIESASRLPDGYTELQYIDMTTGSYLLTDIVPTYDSHIEMDFATTSLSNSPKNYLGGRSATYPAGLTIGHSSNDFGIVAASFGDTYTPNTTFENNTRYKFVFDNKNLTFYKAGTQILTKTFTTTDATGGALAINALNNNGTITNFNEGIYLYSFKAWNTQGELIMDLIPAKNSSDVVGFYDTVSGTFKTATAGTFTAGPEI